MRRTMRILFSVRLPLTLTTSCSDNTRCTPALRRCVRANGGSMKSNNGCRMKDDSRDAVAFHWRRYSAFIFSRTFSRRNVVGEYLVSDLASFISGQHLLLSGGGP